MTQYEIAKRALCYNEWFACSWYDSHYLNTLQHPKFTSKAIMSIKKFNVFPSVTSDIAIYLFFVFCGSVGVSSNASVFHGTIEAGINHEDVNVRRFLLVNNAQENWSSWQQRIACATTCVQGYESETVGCCTTGDNKLCFGLPWKVLNDSVGACAGFCERKEQISCKISTSVLCGSDGQMYENSCEFAKAHCVNNVLIQKDVKFCNTYGTTSSLSKKTTGHISSLAISTMSTKYLQTTSKLNVSPTSAMKSTLTTLLRTSMQQPDTTAKTVQSTYPSASIESTSALISNSTAPPTSTPLTSPSSTNEPTVSTFPSSTFVPTVFTSPSSTNVPIVSTNALTPPSYCQNKQSISCGFTFNVVCGSDGKLYANLCMLALGRCDNPYLIQNDRHYCASG